MSRRPRAGLTRLMTMQSAYKRFFQEQFSRMDWDAIRADAAEHPAEVQGVRVGQHVFGTWNELNPAKDDGDYVRGQREIKEKAYYTTLYDACLEHGGWLGETGAGDDFSLTFEMELAAEPMTEGDVQAGKSAYFAPSPELPVIVAGVWLDEEGKGLVPLHLWIMNRDKFSDTAVAEYFLREDYYHKWAFKLKQGDLENPDNQWPMAPLFGVPDVPMGKASPAMAWAQEFIRRLHFKFEETTLGEVLRSYDIDDIDTYIGDRPVWGITDEPGYLLDDEWAHNQKITDEDWML